MPKLVETHDGLWLKWDNKLDPRTNALFRIPWTVVNIEDARRGDWNDVEAAFEDFRDDLVSGAAAAFTWTIRDIPSKPTRKYVIQGDRQTNCC